MKPELTLLAWSVILAIVHMLIAVQALVGTKGGAPKPARGRKAKATSDIADVAVFLASEAARAVTGAAIEVSWRHSRAPAIHPRRM